MQPLTILLLLFLSQFGVGQPSQCKDLGQYCTSHSDCCSKSCLSFSYKCVEYHGDDHMDEPSSANSIDDIVERINSDSTTNMNEADSNVKPSTSSSTDMNRPETTSYEMDRNVSVCRSNGSSCLNSNQCCTNFCSKITNLCIELTANSLSTEQITNPEVSSTTLSCGQIGSKCYSETDCCRPYHCLGYLHQCVT